MVYADSNTLSGLDENPLFDADDELVVMAKDLGSKRKDQSLPRNVLKVQ